MLRNLRTTALLSFCLAFAPTANAQKYILPKIIVTGAPDYPQGAMLAVIGLKTGSIATQEDVTAAAQRLSDTGLFADIRFESNSTGLVFTVKPAVAGNLLPARFTNLVWWTPAELQAALKSRVPLYIGSVPIVGNLQDSIVAALKSMLAEKGITATVVSMPSSSRPGISPDAITVAIDKPEVRVHSIALTQASPAILPQLQKAIEKDSGQPFEEDTTKENIASQLTGVYRNNGYLDAALITLTHSAPQVSADAINLDLTATVTEGQPYRITSITWSGSDILSAADFNKSLKLHPEDIASELALRQSLAPLANAYFIKGFQDAKVQAPATIDHATQHVSYKIQVVPGPQYRLQSLKTVGLNDAQKKDFDAAWGMKPGDLYDSTYLDTFLLKNTAIKSLLGYSATWRAVADSDTHLVDVTLTFIKGGSLVEVKN